MTTVYQTAPQRRPSGGTVVLRLLLLDLLAAKLAALEIPAAQFDEPRDDAALLAAAMRQHGSEVRRHHAVDALIAEDPTLPADELVEELERRGLLAPSEERVCDRDDAAE